MGYNVKFEKILSVNLFDDHHLKHCYVWKILILRYIKFISTTKFLKENVYK